MPNHTESLMREKPNFNRDNVPEHSKQEKAILRSIRTINYGTVTVTVKDGRPVLIAENKTIKLD